MVFHRMTPATTVDYAVLGHGSSVLNMAGHATGALIFGIFLFLLLRDRAGSRLRGAGLAVSAAALALVWNLGALLLIAVSPAPPVLSAAIEFISFSSLSLLAPVLLQISLNHHCRLAIAGYVIAVAAVALHLADAILRREDLHVYALGLMAVGLGSITIASAFHLASSHKSERQGLIRQMSGTALLFVFIGTYVHVGLEHGMHTWSYELVFHHASVPLALFIILHNHRFVLLDAMIRFSANVLLAALFALAGFRLSEAGAGTLILVLGISVLLLAFALARDRLQKLLTRIVFRRGDAAALAQELHSKAADFRDESEYLDWAEQRIALFMHAERAPEEPSAEAVVPMRFSAVEVRPLLLGRRRGGQPYLSEDLDQLNRFAAVVSEQVQGFREAELRRLAANAELRALQAQINPHFLFNALNTLYGLVPRQAAEAREMVLSLAEVFRYFLRNEETTIPLEEELRIVEAYLRIEALRLGPRLRTEIQVDPEALRMPIPILSIQPLVENAVKHGIASNTAGGLVRVRAHLTPAGLQISVQDTGPGFRPQGSKPGAGVGLDNVARRLKLAYGPDAGLRIETGPNGTAVAFTVPAQRGPANDDRRKNAAPAACRPL
jgi:two-component system LytT family sensor kinase